MYPYTNDYYLYQQAYFDYPNVIPGANERFYTQNAAQLCEFPRERDCDNTCLLGGMQSWSFHHGSTTRFRNDWMMYLHESNFIRNRVSTEQRRRARLRHCFPGWIQRNVPSLWNGRTSTITVEPWRMKGYIYRECVTEQNWLLLSCQIHLPFLPSKKEQQIRNDQSGVKVSERSWRM